MQYLYTDCQIHVVIFEYSCTEIVEIQWRQLLVTILASTVEFLIEKNSQIQPDFRIIYIRLQAAQLLFDLSEYRCDYMGQSPSFQTRPLS